MLPGGNQEMGPNAVSTTQKRTWLWPQILLVIVVWLFLCWLHWDNDGLWSGDAPHHAANGLFWKDFLLSGSFDARGYALSYYARYPVIAPTLYPPVFYVLEAVLFAVLRPSPYLAKGAVLGFALMAALYTSAWARRWIAKDAGWAGALLLLLPGVVLWSHAIMLNIPALGLSVAALYHLRRWLESPTAVPRWRHLYLGAALTVLSILTYVMNSVVVLIAGTWLLLERRWRLLWYGRTLAVFVVSALILLLWVMVVVKGAPDRVAWATGTGDYVRNVSQWQLMYYLQRLPELFGPPLVCLAVFGMAGGMLVRRWRQETIRLLTMTGVCYAFFSYVPVKESRYILLLSVPMVLFCLLGLLSALHGAERLVRATREWERVAASVAVAVLLVSQAWLATRVHVPFTSGYSQLANYLEQMAPDEPVFYDGKGYHVFTFYVQAGDPDFRRRVVLGRKLLFAEGLGVEPLEFVSSPQDVVEVLRERGGCRWVAVADQPDRRQIAAPWHLREAVKGPLFELMKSFPITHAKTSGVERTSVSVYRLLVPIEPIDVIDMPLFSLKSNRFYRTRPIQR